MTNTMRDVPHPAGATYVSEWGNPADPRYFRGTKRVIDRADDQYNGDIVVDVWGTQTREGQVDRRIDVTEGGYERVTLSSAAHARQFGEALIARPTSWTGFNDHRHLCKECGEHSADPRNWKRSMGTPLRSHGRLGA